jgi:hypothetical protein
VTEVAVLRGSTSALLLAALVCCAAPSDAAHHQDLPSRVAPAPLELPSPWLRDSVPGLGDALTTWPPLFRDTQVALHLRTFYFNRNNVDSTWSEAWAAGGWLEYRSGWLADTFRIGATGYTSQPLYAPDTRDGTAILGPLQSPILVVGQAYGQLRYRPYATLTGGRQLIDQGYVNPKDSRMVPYTFEGATLEGDVGPVGYFLGYLTTIKTRESDHFVNVAAEAGALRHDRGLILTSLTLAPPTGLRAYLANYLVPDVFNTTYLHAEFTLAPGSAWSALLGVQLTDQRSTGDHLLGRFATWNVAGRALVEWRGISFIGALSATGPGAAIRTPYGDFPGYLHMIELDFNRANEKAWYLGLAYDWGRGTAMPVRMPGLTMLLAYAQGDHAHAQASGPPQARVDLPLRREGNLEVIWRPPALKGFQFRFRNAYRDLGVEQIQKEFRVILDYHLPLL